MSDTAVVQVDDAQRDVTADAIDAASGWRPPTSWRFLSVDIESVGLLEWIEGELLLTHWDHNRGLERTERRRHDVEASRFAVRCLLRC